MGVRGWSVAVLVALGGLWLASGTQKEKPVVANDKAGALRAMEAEVAASPHDVERLRALVAAYLDARSPGLAVGVVEGAPSDVRADPRLNHLYARALLEQGRNQDALRAEHRVVEACNASASCDPLMLASAQRRIDILEELVRLGVEDTMAHPEASVVAYHNATREARILVP